MPQFPPANPTNPIDKRKSLVSGELRDYIRVLDISTRDATHTQTCTQLLISVHLGRPDRRGVCDNHAYKCATAVRQCTIAEDASSRSRRKSCDVPVWSACGTRICSWAEPDLEDDHVALVTSAEQTVRYYEQRFNLFPGNVMEGKKGNCFWSPR